MIASGVQVGGAGPDARRRVGPLTRQREARDAARRLAGPYRL